MITKYVTGFLFDLRRTKVLLLPRGEKGKGQLDGIEGKVDTERGELPGSAMIRLAIDRAGVTLPTSPTPSGGWYRFATLDAPFIPGNEPAWRIYYYCAFSDDHMARMQEQVALGALIGATANVYLTADLPASILPNLTWLIPMAAWDRRKTYRVEEL